MSDNLPVALCGHSPPKLAMLLLSPSYSDVAAPCSLSQESSQLKVLSQTEPQCYGHWGYTDLPSLKHHGELSWSWTVALAVTISDSPQCQKQWHTHFPSLQCSRPSWLQCYHGGCPINALSWRVPRPWHCDWGHHDCHAIMEAATNVILSWRLPQMWCYCRGCCKYHTVTEVNTNVMLSWRMPQMQLYAKAAANATLSWRLCKHFAISMDAATAAFSWEDKKM